MLRIYFTSSLRFLKKNIAFTALSFSGLLFGFLACLYLVSYIHRQSNYDNFHPDVANTYRLQIGQGEVAPKLFPALAGALQAQCGDCETLRLKRATGDIGTDNAPFQEQKVYWADKSFLNIFGYKLIAGDKNGLALPNKAYVTKTLFRKLYGNLDLEEGDIFIFSDVYRRETSFEIVGILEDVPGTSHLTFDAILSYSTLPESHVDYQYGWSWRGIYTYVRTKHPVDLPVYYQKIVASRESLPYQSINAKESLTLIPLPDIHLRTGLTTDAEVYGNSSVLTAVKAFAVILFAFSIFNYLNLTTVSAVFRKREVGIKKVLGAARRHIIVQSLMEAMVLFTGASLIAILVFVILHPHISGWVNLSSLSEIFLNLGNVLIFLVVLLSGALLATAYVLIFLSRVSPSSIFNNDQQIIRFNPSQGVMTVQLLVALFLLTCAFGIFLQIDFMRSKDLGFNTERILIIKPSRGEVGSPALLSSKLNELSSVKSVSLTTQIPGKKISTSVWSVECEDKTFQAVADAEFNLIETDAKFAETFSIPIQAGRSFIEGEKAKLILNETAALHLGFKSPDESIGKRVLVGDESLEVVGVLKNYHHLSVKENFLPILITSNMSSAPYHAVKIQSDDLRGSVDELNRLWKQVYPQSVFDYFFLDEAFNQAYQEDIEFGKTIGGISILLLLISYLGLIGTVIFLAQKRAKEICIRRVLGSSSFSIVLLFVKSTIVQIVIASVVALPGAYFLLKEWLKTYAFTIDLTVDIFAVPLTLIAILSVILIAVIVRRVSLSTKLSDALKGL